MPNGHEHDKRALKAFRLYQSYQRKKTLINGTVKLLLNILILAGLGALIWYGYRLFTRQVSSLLILIIGVAAWVLIIWLLRSRYRWTKPGFILTTFLVIIVVLILAFDGVQPLAGYKDTVVKNVTEWSKEWAEPEIETTEVERRLSTTEPGNTITPPETSYPPGKPTPTNTKPQGEDSDTEVIPGILIWTKDSKFKDYKTGEIIDTNTALKMVYEYEKKLNDTPPLLPSPMPTVTATLSQDAQTPIPSINYTKYMTLFNDFRSANGLQTLQFTKQLNDIARLRVKEIAIKFSHDGIEKYGNFGENIAMSTGGYLSDEGALMLWQNSLGHRQNMLNPIYKITGYANAGGYAVQIFSW